MSSGCWKTRAACWLFLAAAGWPAASEIAAAETNALRNYLRAADTSFAWEEVGRSERGGSRVIALKLTSQRWREFVWQHELTVVIPARLTHPETALLHVTGDGRAAKYVDYLNGLAQQAGAVAAVINRVPNQPNFGGKKEDALIAHTFSQFIQSGDETWPLLFPMVKAAVRAMDAVQQFTAKESATRVGRFVVTGASKRGWTTWLTGATDARVAGIAPMVFDILNMKVQTDWAGKIWGNQSEMIRDYTDLGLVEQLETPRMTQIRGWVDPYSYRRHYTMPKLLLLGTNDRYWVLDSTRHYFDELPGPKLIHQTPNAGHNLGDGREASQTLASFLETIAAGAALPRLHAIFHGGSHEALRIEVRASEPVREARLWTARSDSRDFREARWSDRQLPLSADLHAVDAVITRPESGFRSALVSAKFRTPSGAAYWVSTEARVVPDRLPGEVEDLSNVRMPMDGEAARYWLENMVAHHGFSLDEVHAATGLPVTAIEAALRRDGVQRLSAPARGHDGKLKALPYPGGRHPRIGFLDGAVKPQRETKISVFTPWDPGSYVVVDVPEAIWSNLGLTYLAHTHVPTVWSRQGIELPRLEWNRHADGRLDFTRELPNGITFGARVTPRTDRVDLELWLRNGTREKLTGLRVQNCVMLKGARGFEAQSNDNKVLQKPFVAAGNDARDKWIITAWEPCFRPWANPPCPCLHSDPQFPDAEPGATVTVRGALSFYEGTDLSAELKRLSITWKLNL